MTFVLGLTGEKINSRYLPKTHYNATQTAVAQGAKLLNRYNCTGCHTLEMPRYTIAAGTKLDEALTDFFQTNVKVSYNNRATDFLAEFYPGESYDEKKKPELSGDDGKPIVIEGMPIGTFENELTVQLWRPVTIRGFRFHVGDNLTLNASKVEVTPPKGGGLRLALRHLPGRKDR